MLIFVAMVKRIAVQALIQSMVTSPDRFGSRVTDMLPHTRFDVSVAKHSSEWPGDLLIDHSGI